MSLLDKGDNALPENCRRLVLLGSNKVGKSAIVSRFLYDQFDGTYTPTVENFHRKIYKIRGETYRLDILDTSGFHPFPAMRRLSYVTGWKISMLSIYQNTYKNCKSFHSIFIFMKWNEILGYSFVYSDLFIYSDKLVPLLLGFLNLIMNPFLHHPSFV